MLMKSIFYKINKNFYPPIYYLVAIRKPAHTGHNAKDVVVGGVDADLGGLCALDGGVRQDELKSRVVDAREVAGARRLVLLRAERERVNVDAGVRSTRVVLPRLNLVEVGALTLREAVLSVKL